MQKTITIILFCIYSLVNSITAQARIVSDNICPTVSSLIIKPLPPIKESSNKRYQWLGYDNYQREMWSLPQPEFAPDTDHPDHLSAVFTNQSSSSGTSYYFMCQYKDTTNLHGGYISDIVSGYCRLNRVDYQADEYISYCYPENGECHLICSDH